MTTKSDLRKMHPIEDLGVVSVARGEIRAEPLQNRLVPRVPFPHKHDFYQLLLVTSGSGSHEIDFARHRVSARSIFLMKPGQVHSWSLSPSTAGFVIDFTADSFGPLRSRAPVAERLPFFNDAFSATSAEWKSLILLAQEMVNEFTSQPANFQLLLRDYLSALLIKLARLPDSHQGDLVAQSGDMDQFIHLIEEHFHLEHSVEFYAKKLGLRAQALTMRTSRLFGKSAREMIQERYLLEAKRLLAYSDQPISRISDELGFEDPNYFARLFRKEISLTPGEFRKKARQ